MPFPMISTSTTTSTALASAEPQNELPRLHAVVSEGDGKDSSAAGCSDKSAEPAGSSAPCPSGTALAVPELAAPPPPLPDNEPPCCPTCPLLRSELASVKSTLEHVESFRALDERRAEQAESRLEEVTARAEVDVDEAGRARRNAVLRLAEIQGRCAALEVERDEEMREAKRIKKENEELRARLVRAEEELERIKPEMQKLRQRLWGEKAEAGKEKEKKANDCRDEEMMGQDEEEDHYADAGAKDDDIYADADEHEAEAAGAGETAAAAAAGRKLASARGDEETARQYRSELERLEIATKLVGLRTEREAPTAMEEVRPPALDTAAENPGENDVVLGRGGKGNNHIGNKRYLKMAEVLKAGYKDLKRVNKTKESYRLVNMVHAAGGRFLEQDPETNLWVEVDHKRARRKASQALRDAMSRAEKSKKGVNFSLHGKKKEEASSQAHMAKIQEIASTHRC